MNFPQTDTPEPASKCVALPPDGVDDESLQPGNKGPGLHSTSAPVTDVLSLNPTIENVPCGLVETGRQTPPLPGVVVNQSVAAETTRLFIQLG
jgi:hypothetical protein